MTRRGHLIVLGVETATLLAVVGLWVSGAQGYACLVASTHIAISVAASAIAVLGSEEES